jgi:hypothetical protein
LLVTCLFIIVLFFPLVLRLVMEQLHNSQNDAVKAARKQAQAISKANDAEFKQALEELKQDIAKRVTDLHDKFKASGKHRGLDTIRSMLFHGLSDDAKERAPTMYNALQHAESLIPLLDSMCEGFSCYYYQY